MTNDGTELAEGESYKQIQTIEPVRRYLREQTKGSMRPTNSDYLVDTVLPKNWEEIEHSIEDEQVSLMRIRPDAHDRIDSMTGDRMDQGEVMAFYCMVDAMRQSDNKAVNEIVDSLPNLLWSIMETRE